MIRYRLACTKGHDFEAWFPSSDGYERQVKKKLVACPTCGSTRVDKALMAPSVVTSEQKSAARKRRRAMPEAPATPAAAGPSAKAETQSERVLAGPQREMLRQLKVLRDKVLEKSEYVGPRFAEEARKIHNEESSARGIYGEASRQEVEELASDGIDVLPIPVLPDDQN